jgi:putative endonuclease
MMNRKNIGTAAEEEAAHYLRANGYEILARNWRWQRYEIDLITKKEETLVFVEVKTRRNEKFGYPEEFLSAAQEERIYLAAEAYCDEHAWRGAIRFDIIAILQNAFPNHLDHLVDAF